MQKFKLLYDQLDPAKKKLYREFWYGKLIDSSELWEVDIPERLKEDFAEFCSRRNRVGKYKYIMFTINFEEGTSFEKAWKLFIKYAKKKWIKKSYSCFEWREMNKGMHIHSKVWVDDNKNSYVCKREVYNTFKHAVGNKMHVNARYSNRDGCFEKYIDGLTGDEFKDCFVVTEEMCRINGIKNPIIIEGGSIVEKKPAVRIVNKLDDITVKC